MGLGGVPLGSEFGGGGGRSGGKAEEGRRGACRIEPGCKLHPRSPTACISDGFTQAPRTKPFEGDLLLHHLSVTECPWVYL